MDKTNSFFLFFLFFTGTQSTLLEGSIKKIIISFLDDYKNVRKNKNILKDRPFVEEDYQVLGSAFSKSAKQHGMTVQTCFEERNLKEYGFQIGECFSHTLAYQMTGKKYKNWKARKGNQCNCVQMVDIGAYNTCPHLCKYCYANYCEEEVFRNRFLHDPKSSLLLGHLTEEDKIQIRKEK